MLAILTSHYNPIGFDRQKKNAECFYQQMPLQIRNHVYSINADFGGQDMVLPFHGRTVRASDKNIMWQKERMLNLALATLPPEYDQVCWVDADLIFTNPYWYEQTEESLRENAVTQMFSAVINTNRFGEFLERRHGVGWRVKNKPGDITGWYRPGGAWAARREIAETCIPDEHISGGGDCMTAFAWTGEFDRWRRHIAYSGRWAKHYDDWARRQNEMVAGRIGYVQGDVIHLWHGDRENRQYNDRAKILERHNFDPFEDIRIGDNGLWEWSTDRPEMHNAIRKYFVRRREDG